MNSRALELAGITAATPARRGGRAGRRRDAQRGAPRGRGISSGAWRPSRRPTSPPRRPRGPAVPPRLGITAWQDAAVSASDWGDNYSAYRRAERGELTARVIGALWWDRERGEEQVEELAHLRDEGRVGRFRADEREDHAGRRLRDVHRRGAGALPRCRRASDGSARISFVDPDALKGYVTALDALGFQVHFHAGRTGRPRVPRRGRGRPGGERAGDRRHHLAHLQVVHPDDVPRFRQLRAVANAQPLWAAHEPQMDDLTIPFLGEPRWRWQYPSAAWSDRARPCASGAIGPSPPPTPAGAARRREPVMPPTTRTATGRTAKCSCPRNASTSRRDRGVHDRLGPREPPRDDTGSIEVGKLADLAIVDRDLFGSAERDRLRPDRRHVRRGLRRVPAQRVELIAVSRPSCSPSSALAR